VKCVGHEIRQQQDAQSGTKGLILFKLKLVEPDSDGTPQKKRTTWENSSTTPHQRRKTQSPIKNNAALSPAPRVPTLPLSRSPPTDSSTKSPPTTQTASSTTPLEKAEVYKRTCYKLERHNRELKAEIELLKEKLARIQQKREQESNRLAAERREKRSESQKRKDRELVEAEEEKTAKKQRIDPEAHCLEENMETAKERLKMMEEQLWERHRQQEKIVQEKLKKERQDIRKRELELENMEVEMKKELNELFKQKLNTLQKELAQNKMPTSKSSPRIKTEPEDDEMEMPMYELGSFVEEQEYPPTETKM